MPEATTALRRSLGTWDLTLLAVVAVANLNVIPAIAGNGAVIVWLWLAAFLFFFLPQGIAVVELAQRMPGEGGIYLWAKESFGDFHGFLCGWCYWTSNMFFVPTLLFALAGTGVYLFGGAAGPLTENRFLFLLVTSGLLWLTVILNILGMGVGKWVNNAGAAGTLFLAALLMVLGCFYFVNGNRAVSLSSFSVFANGLPPLSQFGVICFALVGLELGAVMGGEIRSPQRTIPRSVLFGGLLSALLYLGVTFTLLLVVPAGQMTVMQGTLQALDKMINAPHLIWMAPLTLVLLVAIAGATSAWVGGSARIMFVSGLDRFMPRVLGRIHPKYGTPHMSLLAFGGLTTVLIGMSFLGASVKEAFLTLLDLAVVIQMVAYLYLFAALSRIAFQARPALFLPVAVVRCAAVSGFAASAVGIVMAFVPSRQIKSVLAFEIKMVIATVAFLGLAAGLYRYYSRKRLSLAVV